MTVTTKFNQGDKPFIMENNSIIQKEITDIGFHTSHSETMYYFKGENISKGLPESKLFQTKEELLKSL